MYPIRDDEPAAAFLPQAATAERNRYGQPIQLIDENDPLAGQSLNINNDPGVGENPNRYKQHGFYFKADHCIGCHACEAACSEKNDLPAHISFRSVGYIEGGSYPDYHRLNISMACNHCDDPVCLKGCPTRAYTKFAEYGAVLQDPDICFGCGYCTWVCPYNAPQLDPVKGEVSKCNMCVDRLEVGLKPACVAACLAGALDFGVIETTPANRHQLEPTLPGFPTAEITHPNIRFEQTRSLPREMRRPDSIPLRYERDEQGAEAFKPKAVTGKIVRDWGLGKLRSREDPLVIFTLISQMVIGAFLVIFLGPVIGPGSFMQPELVTANAFLLFTLIGLETGALVLSTLHLGKPQRFYRAFNNLRYSPVSREVAGLAVFYNFLLAYAVLDTFPGLFTWLLPVGLVEAATALCGWGAVLAGLLALYFMQAIYRIRARPFWNHWQVVTSFYGSMLTLGALVVGLVYAFVLAGNGLDYAPLLSVLAWPMAAGLLLESAGLLAHARDLRRGSGEGAASHHRQLTAYGKTYLARNAGLGIGALAVIAAALLGPGGAGGLLVWSAIVLLILATALAGRALFYVLVMPTTLPGAFFWRNPAFEAHARETGLANMPQVGIVPDAH